MHRFLREELASAPLVIDAVYEGGRSGNAGDDPLHPLLGVSNQGGFRYLGNLKRPQLIVLTSSFDDPDWPDRIDRETGVVEYFGDNKRPGRSLHDTPRFGNELLRQVFDAAHGQPSKRGDVPPILLFGNAGEYRDVIFLGLLVPGTPQQTGLEDLVAVWKLAEQKRFQNYRSTFTVLDVPDISRDWIDEIRAGNVLSPHCPPVWRNWVETGTYQPLRAERAIEYRTKAEQLPSDRSGRAVIHAIHSAFCDEPVQFEHCAARLVQLMDSNFISCDVTRPTRDGGRDAVGLYRIGFGPASVRVEYALEAKCYGLNNSVGVKEVARLISRLRHRQFGILVTTSYLHQQAYRELTEDKHPVIVIAARDIVSILKRAGITSDTDVRSWIVGSSTPARIDGRE